MVASKADEVISIDEKAGTVTIILPLAEWGLQSKSGKTMRVCSTEGGLRTSVMYHNKPITVNVNAYVSAD